jgi:asparagine synthase (glutamine-hydrolysing)
MCGICGIVDLDGGVFRDRTERMTDALTHRGPDMGGVYEIGSSTLGHRRLSIIDLTEAAGQPMISTDGKTAIVFNGEIYNFKDLRARLQSRGHKFRTHSDTEVALEMYRSHGPDMLAELNGMFGMAIWDDRQKALFLARDRMGKKPLYYMHNRGRLVFSSEMWSLLQSGLTEAEIDRQALFEYFLYDFIPAPHTIYSDVRKLPAAHYAIFNADGLKIYRYWEPPPPDPGLGYEEARGRLRELIDDAVRIRLIADVPLGSFLSGGVDSSLVSSVMCSQAHTRVKTFSVSFPDTTYDESHWARLAASRLDTDHHEFAARYDIEHSLPELVKHFGEPFGDSSAVPTLLLAEGTRKKVTVALSGDGGDELFGGYDRYIARRMQTYYDVLPLSLRDRIIEPVIAALPATTQYYGTSIIKKLKLFTEAAQRMRNDPAAAVPRTFPREVVTRLLGGDYDEDRDPVRQTVLKYQSLDPVQRMLFADLETYLAEDILTKVDRTSMTHALEVRCPLLDYRIVELACRMPLEYKIRFGSAKRILKDVARNIVPSEILDRRKYGFQAPLGEWLKKELRDWAGQRLMYERNSILDPDVARSVWDDHLNGVRDNGHRIWLLLFFQEWHERARAQAFH